LERTAETQINATLEILAAELPIYSVHFGKGGMQVAKLGNVPSRTRAGESIEKTTALPMNVRITAKSRNIDLSELDDWELVRRTQAGDMLAFAQIYQRYYKIIFEFISRSHIRPRATIEDLTSQTFLKALRGIGRLSWLSEDSVGPWLGTIATRVVADHRKSSTYRREVLVDPTTPWGRSSDVTEDDALDAVVRHNSRASLAAAVRRLPPHYRLCLQLRFVEQLSVEETGHRI
jgi:RNA polymerase sigma-70 factor, ECF subfamily